jgi:hypothetical protein
MQQILHYLETGDYAWGEGNDRGILPPFDIKAKDFLNFGQNNQKLHYPDWEIDCLSNAKRAISCQLDSLLYAFGLANYAEYSFPKKIELIRDLEIVAPSMLKKINTYRNYLEHDYVRPGVREAEDALEIAELFLAYTDRFINSIWDYVGFYPAAAVAKDHPNIFVDYDYNKGHFDIEEIWDENSKSNLYRKIEINKDSEFYLIFLKLYIKLCVKI